MTPRLHSSSVLAVVWTLLAPSHELHSADFVVKSVAYAESKALYEFKSEEIPANQSATMTITFEAPRITVDEQVREVVNSVRSSIPLKIVVSDPTSSGPNIKITVTITAAVKEQTTASVTYTRTNIARPIVSYDLDLDLKKLSGFVLIKDESRSNAKWIDAAVRINRRIGDLVLRNVTLSQGESAVVRIAEIVDHDVEIEPAKFLIIRQHRRAHQARLLTCDLTLQKGDLRIFNNGRFVGAGELETDLLAGKAQEIFAEEVPEILVDDDPAQTERCHEAIDLHGSKLSVRFWIVRRYVLTNDSGSEVSIRLDNWPGTIVVLPAKGKENSQVEQYVSLTERRPAEIDLLDFSNENLGRLQEIRLVAPSIHEKLLAASNSYASIVELSNRLTKLDELRKANDDAISQMRQIKSPGNIIEHLEQHREQLRKESRESAGKRAQELVNLTRALFP